jgi:hypothetical protein
MALQINLPESKSDVGVSSPAAYARIVKLVFDTSTITPEQPYPTVRLVVNTFATKAARDAGKSPIRSKEYSGFVGKTLPSLDEALSTGVRGALYTWLKTLPDFQGATDV